MRKQLLFACAALTLGGISVASAEEFVPTFNYKGVECEIPVTFVMNLEPSRLVLHDTNKNRWYEATVESKATPGINPKWKPDGAPKLFTLGPVKCRYQVPADVVRYDYLVEGRRVTARYCTGKAGLEIECFTAKGRVLDMPPPPTERAAR